MKTLTRIISILGMLFLLYTASLFRISAGSSAQTQNFTNAPRGILHHRFSNSNEQTVPPDYLIKQISPKNLNDEFGQTATRRFFAGDDTLVTDAISERILNGYAAEDAFGFCVANAGDVNADGFDDVIVGAPNSDYTAVDAGRAYIYFGGVTFNSTPDVIINGGGAGYFFGRSVACAGDVNGDSYDDVIIGAYGYNSNQGRTYIYYGGDPMNISADLTIIGEMTGDNFGECVAGAGDVNGDGFCDVIVGAPLNTSATGKSYIYFGGSLMNNTADVTMTGPAVNSAFGRSVSTAGDMNGDGFSDVIVGASSYNTNTGRTYVYTGGSTMDNVADLTMTGSASNYYFGYRATTAGDMNGDGYSDVIVGANGYSSSRGRAYIYFGTATLNSTADILLYGEASGDNFGICVAPAGDYNCDGYGDVIIGANNFNSGTGKAYLYQGGETPDDNADKFFNGEAFSDAFGTSVSLCGDINGDGNSDLVAGAYSNDINGSNSGRAYIFMNSMSGPDIPDLTITGASDDDFLGYPSSKAGDVNGDGYDDIIVGASSYNAGTDQGRAYIFYGGAIINNTSDVTLTGVSASDFFGNSATYAGDVNGDGYDDVIVGADGYNAGTDQGRAYIYFGGSSMNSTADVVLTGASAGDNFGFSTSDAGDVNGDGFGDVIVGAYGYNAGTNAGRAYIYFGGSAMNNSADVTLSYSGNYNNFGYSVSGAGDLNGDGYDDVVVGAYRYDGGTDQGQVLVYFGGSNMNIYPDLMITGASAGDGFGESVSEAGDVNGDGYADLIVGAYGYNAGYGQGRAYIYYGGQSMNATADVTITGTSNGDDFGICVSRAGDINGDGYSDVIVGAYSYPFGYAAGKAYVYFGGSAMNTTADITMDGEENSDAFGGWVSSAGDMNADGLDDIVIGAPWYQSLAYRGRAYLYISSSPEVKPRIYSAKDVPFDQGGNVKLRWNRSGFDAPGQSLVTSYRVEMSDPPAGGNFTWELAGSVTASNNTTYQFTANTPNDSMSGNSGVQYFRITAVTSDPDQSWRSNIVSAYSVDNLAPFAPQNLNGTPDNNSIYLDWDQNLEADLHHYVIYRNGVEYQNSVNSFFDDVSVQEDSTYNYQVAAVDIHGNISGLSNIEIITYNNFGNIILSVIMEGFYDANLNAMNASDTAGIYLRKSTSPYTIIDSSKAVINSSSFTGSFNMMNAATGNYYIVIRHRNTLETWSAAPVAYTAGGVTSYSFITSITQAYGSNMIQIDASPLRFAIFSGDVKRDGTVDGTDVSAIDNDAYNFVSGYVVSDLTGDNFVDASDFSIADNNAANFVSISRP